ncbi:MAG: diaminopimelate epimerase [Desulfotomaculaceae bacterium]|nr:diaminopimelate epimerase [Desulfotomaculaceae bacterium]
MRFTKVHGLGNDFILVDCFEENIETRDLSKLALRLCDRHYGIGADGLVVLLPSETADVKMRIFNPDGSEAEMCGNAIRCAAKYLFEHGLVNKNQIKVDTLAGILHTELITANDQVKLVRVDMGEPHLDRLEIPMTGPSGRVISEPLEAGGITYQVTAVSMGNPHCIVVVPDVERIPLSVVGPVLERHSAFPNRTNVEFIQLVNLKEIKMRVWERGAGETMACGTGACAAVVACALNGFTSRRVTVHLKTGELLIEWGADNHVYMTGPAEEVFTGEYQVL